MCEPNVGNIDTVGNYVVLIVAVVIVVVFNAQRFERIIFAFLHPIIVPQFM
jgi:hypothetical protein